MSGIPQDGRDQGSPASALSGIKHVILDRDGVLNEEDPHGRTICNPESFRWLPGVLKALSQLRASRLRITVATNQSGVGRGYLSQAALNAIHEAMCHQASAAGAAIDAVFSCVHAPEENCLCRKPAPGLISKAVLDSGIPLCDTLVVGDAARDLEAARAAGAHAALLRTGKGRRFEAQAKVWGIPIFDSLQTLTDEITRRRVGSEGALRALFADHVTVVELSAQHLVSALAQCIDIATRALRDGHKILACGNGGSAADAQHFVAELVGRYKNRRRALPAIALTGDPVTMTAIANDFGYSEVFARAVEVLALPGDVLLAISTSGNSSNVIRAAEVAKQQRCAVIAFTGPTGGALAQYADILLPVPSPSVARIQEVHTLCLHGLAEALDAHQDLANSA